MPFRPLHRAEAEARLTVSQTVAARGGKLAEAARTLRVSTITLRSWLRENSPELLAKLVDPVVSEATRRRKQMSQAEAMARLSEIRRMQAEGRTAPEIAKQLGISRVGLYRWLSRHVSSDDVLLERLKDNATVANRERSRLSPAQKRTRLVALKACASVSHAHVTPNKVYQLIDYAAASKRTGVKPATLKAFVYHHAPDGIDAALAELGTPRAAGRRG